MQITHDYYIEHYGVKGMQWGVRRDRRANTHVKVGEGLGNKSERIRSALTVGPVDLVKGGGFRGAAARRGKRQIDRNARVRAGESSAKDKIAYYGGSKYQDVFPTGKSSTNTKAAVGATIAGYLVVANGIALAKALSR